VAREFIGSGFQRHGEGLPRPRRHVLDLARVLAVLTDVPELELMDDLSAIDEHEPVGPRLEGQLGRPEPKLGSDDLDLGGLSPWRWLAPHAAAGSRHEGECGCSCHHPPCLSHVHSPCEVGPRSRIPGARRAGCGSGEARGRADRAAPRGP
jgi:hypothetical protein